MKKIFFGILAVVAMIATSCQQDVELGVNGGDVATVSIEVGTPTRAYSDGTTATVLQYAVYEEDTELGDLTVTDGEIHGSTTVNLQLVTGNTYTVIFWAAAPNAPYTVDFANKTMTVGYTSALSNDENRDAFYAKHTFTVHGAQTETITLKRPFAQLNIGTSDYAASTSAGYTPEHSKVTVKNIYNTLNLWNGKVDGNQEVVYNWAEIKKDEEFPVAGYEYLAMNYLLVNEQEPITVVFEYSEKENVADKVRTVGSVPVQRNYRTNLYGQLLTSEVDINVTIDPIYEDKYNNEHDYYIEEGTIYITSANGLKIFAEKVNAGDPEWLNANVALSCDIDLAATRSTSNWTPIGTSTDLAHGKTYRGTFDGKGHTIRNMVCQGQEIAGLFGYLYDATIKNVTIENATINSNHYAGGIVAWVNNLTGNTKVPFVIENCHVKNSTITSAAEEVNGEWDNGDKVGGIVGAAWFSDAKWAANEGAKIANCSVEATTIKAYRDFGGLVGYAQGVILEGCTTKSVTLEQDLTHDYKDTTPTTFGYTVGNNAGGNTIDGKPYHADGVTQDEDGNYHIYNAAGLKWVADNVNTMEYYVNSAKNILDDKIVYLTNDIDLENAEWTPIGDYAFSRTIFSGVFDGQGHTISNFKITKLSNRPDKVAQASYGFFGNMAGTVKNLKIDRATVTPEANGAYVGVLVGRLKDSAVIDNCHITNSVATTKYWQVGGIVGQLEDASVIKNSSISTTTVTGKAAAGAIAGLIMNAGEYTIENCAVNGCTIVQNGSFGDGYDTMFGLAAGAINDGSVVLNLNNNIFENNTIKGEASQTLVGYVEEGAKYYINGKLAVATVAELEAALKAGGEFILANDIALTKTFPISNANFVLDGNGCTISQTAECTNTYALFDITNGKVTFKNVVFDGIQTGAVIRTVYAESNFENVTAKNCNHTVSQGMFRLIGKATLSNCKFVGNECKTLITYCFDAEVDEPFVLNNCLIENNSCTEIGVVYYVGGSSATITNNKFVGNVTNVASNGATLYMGFTEGNVITGNLFQNNEFNTTSSSKRVTAGVHLGYATTFTGNAFVGNVLSAPNSDNNGKGNDVCASVYYTDIDLSGNYWGGNAPVENDDYFVEYPTYHSVIINDYLTVNPF